MLRAPAPGSRARSGALPAVFFLCVLGGCDGGVVSPASPIVQGIVEWVGPPPGNGGEGGEVTVLRARIELPDTIVSGVEFRATVVTLRPSGCWYSDSVGAEREGNRIELVMWVRGPRPGQVCPPTSAGELSRRITLSFPESGPAMIELVGRRVEGDAPAHDPFTGEPGRLEFPVVVRPPPAAPHT